ncbi:MAG: glycosyltransferase family 9 protein [Chloroherpetonaceae bacterium]|nr:glycosyltransferase family 9 protein [Chloroherpetonaceae bacterium]
MSTLVSSSIPQNKTPHRILFRSPNWLGDVVMSLGFVKRLREAYPKSEIIGIAKKGLEPLLSLSAPLTAVYGFSKTEHRGVLGLRSFAHSILKSHGEFDLFISLPESFSTALLGWFTGAKVRVGFGGEFRSLLLSSSLPKPQNLHRTEEYAALLNPAFHHYAPASQTLAPLEAKLKVIPSPLLLPFAGMKKIVLNLCSESPSKVVPLRLGIELAEDLLRDPRVQLIVTGIAKERAYLDAFQSMISAPERMLNLGGKTSVVELASVLAGCDLVISTDSGTAHLANAVGSPTVVLNGAGDERNTHPYHLENSIGLRVSGLSCAPCVSTVCKFGEPKCLAEMKAADVLAAASAIQRGG